MATRIRPPDLQVSIAAILAETQSIPIQHYEGESRENVTNLLVPKVCGVAARAAGFLTELLEQYEAQEEPATRAASGNGLDTHRGILAQVDQLMEQESTRIQISDLAFLGRLSLRKKMETLATCTWMGEASTWQVLGLAGSCLRTVRKALTAVEVSLCERENLVSQLHFEDELRVSLQARQAYAQLRQEIRQYDSRPNTLARLQGAAASLAKLVHCKIYPNLRIEDRAHLRQLQERILSWSHKKDPVAGAQLWEDICGFAELLGEIRKREELVAHDQDIARKVREDALKAELSEQDLRAELEPLLGRDDSLDDWLAFQTVPAGVAPRAFVLQILDRLVTSP